MLLLIDGNNMAHRAKHSYKLTNRGVDVGTTFGVIKMITALISKFNADAVIVAWDYGIPDYRRVAVPSYKANRKHGVDDPLEYERFVEQMNELHNSFLPYAGILSIKKLHVEADDLLYHASILSDEDTVIISNDKDLLQAISSKTSVYLPGKDLLVTEDNFESVTGISKKHYIHWRAIQGDSSDNIPGVPGIGEKTATKLFNELGSLTAITNTALNIDPVHKGMLSEKLSFNIRTFGFDAICKNVYVTALYADRTGSRMEIMYSTYEWEEANTAFMKLFLKKNAFTSLMNRKFLDTYRLLRAPAMKSEDEFRLPVVYPKKFPVVRKTL